MSEGRVFDVKSFTGDAVKGGVVKNDDAIGVLR